MIRKLFGSCAIGAAVAGMIDFTAIGAQAAVTYDTRALTGDAAPGTGPGVVYGVIASAPAFNSTGQVAFRSSVTGPGVDLTNITGIWSGGSGSLNLVARTGSAAPGAGAGVEYFRLFTPKINDAGQTAFSASLAGTGVGRTNFTGLWSEGSGSLNLLARAGSVAPGTSAGATFSQFSFGTTTFNPLLDNVGQTVFLAPLTGTNVDVTNDEGIWSERSGLLSLVAREGNAAAGTGPGVVFGNLAEPLLNTAGQTVFWGTLTGTGVDHTNDVGIWSDQAGSLSLLVRAGDTAPGTDPGVVYSSVNAPALNNAGQTAFTAELTGPGITLSNDKGLWSEGSGSLGLVAREGDTAIDLPADVVYSSFGALDLNDAGRIAFAGSLTGPGVSALDNSGLWSEGSGSLSLIARQFDAAPGTAPGVRYSTFNGVNPVLNGAGQTSFMGRLSGTGVDDTNDRGIWATDPNGLLTLIVRSGDLFDVNDDPLIEDLRTISTINLATGGSNAFMPTPAFNDAGQLAFTLRFTDNTSGVFVAIIPEPASLVVLAVGTGMILSKRSTNLS